MSKLKKTNKKSFLKFFIQSYKISTLNKSTLKERSLVNFKGHQLFIYFLYFFIFLVFIIFLLFAYTPLSGVLPEANVNKEKKIIDLVVRIDSLEKDLLLKKQYMDIINRIVRGEVVDSFLPIVMDTNLILDSLNLRPSKEDSILRKMVKKEDFYNISTAQNPESSDLEDFVFFKPVGGVVISGFEISEKHYGVDVVTHEGAAVKACLDGVVIFSDWSISHGNMILIQHVDNIISVYMHNSILTKVPNDLVKAGEVIGIVGNSGELSSGPHLHFELWQNGSPINPEEYIDF